MLCTTYSSVSARRCMVPLAFLRQLLGMCRGYQSALFSMEWYRERAVVRPEGVVLSGRP